MQTLAEIEKTLQVQDDYWPRRSDAITALAEYPLSKSYDLLQLALKDINKYVRQKAIETLNGYNAPTATSLLILALKDKYHYNRELAFSGLCLLYTDKLKKILITAIDRKREETKTRKNMIWSLRHISKPVFSDIIIKWFSKLDLNDTDYFILLEVIRSQKDEKLTPLLLELSNHKKLNGTSKNRLVEALGILKEKRGLNFILNHVGHYFATNNYSDPTCLAALLKINSPDLYLSLLAKKRGRKKDLLIQAIGQLEYTPALEKIKKIYSSSKSIDTQLACVEALQKIGPAPTNYKATILLEVLSGQWLNWLAKDIPENKKEDLQQLLQLLCKSYQLNISRKAIEYLGYFDNTANLTAILPQISASDYQLRNNALKAIVKLRPKAAVIPLIEFLQKPLSAENPFDDTRRLAIRALGDIGDAQAIPFLKELLKTKVHFKPSNVTHSCVEILESLQKLKATEAFDCIVQHSLLDNNTRIRSKAQEVLLKMGWNPRNITEEVYWLVSKEQWHELIEFGKEAVPTLSELSEIVSIYCLEYLMACLASLADESYQDQILAWLCQPYYSYHSKKNILARSPFYEPMFGELTEALLIASSIVDCQEEGGGNSSSYKYSLETAIEATDFILKQNSALSKKICRYLKKKKPVELTASYHEEYGGYNLTFKFTEQIAFINKHT